MTIKYSPTTNGFYFSDVDYGSSLPPDLIDISNCLYRELLEGQSAGKIITSNNNASPTLCDPVIDFVEKENRDRQELIDAALKSVSVIQLKLQTGREISDVESRKLNSILDYIDELSAVEY
ncbi:tail fiber assembly protein [Kluyvera ascorbata]|uniref:Tail fiber assembly protein n=1 Tax=Kluyvera ascorbata TaxID=51288 RepID=A0AB35XH03_9ENTR